MQQTFLSRLEWRFATKKFDATKKVSAEDVNKILHAIRFAPTSFGLQPFHVVRVTDGETRNNLRAASWDQAQVTDASDFLVFCARNDITERIDAYLEMVTGGDKDALQNLEGYKNMMHHSLDTRSGNETGMAWAARQAYLALGFGLAAAAELGIDTCPMEGFDPAQVNAILKLPVHTTSLAYLAIGYRSAEPEFPKARFPEGDLITTI